MSQQNTSSREYFRTPVRVRVRYGPDTDEGRHAMAMDTELWRTQDTLEEAARRVWEKQAADSMSPFVDVLRWMDFKIDMLLHLVRTKELDRHFPHSLESVDLSGSGIGVGACGALVPGTKLLLSIILPNSPWRPVYAAGEVVRSDQPDENDLGICGIRFSELADSDRERIIRFTFEQQRRLLAQRTQETDH